jgi:hypothetical protein
MSVVGMLAWFAAAVSLWLGARTHPGSVARGYRWLSVAAAGYCAGLVLAQVLGGELNPASGLSFADLPSLLALAAAAVGIAVLARAERDAEAGYATEDRADRAAGPAGSGSSVLPGLADGYVVAVALLVIGWVTLFSSEFHRSGDRPGTFLLTLIHPLADLAVLGMLLPAAATCCWWSATWPATVSRRSPGWSRPVTRCAVWPSPEPARPNCSACSTA